MGRRLIGLLAGAALALTAASASGAPFRLEVRARCGTKAIDVYFWPKGHPAIPSIDFPAYPLPHLEVYLPGGRELAFTNANEFAFGKACVKVGDRATRWSGRPSLTTRRTRKIRCRFSKVAELKLIPLKNGSGEVTGAQFIATAGHTPGALVHATISAGESTLRYGSRYCRQVPLPTK